MKFQFGNVVVVEGGLIGVVVKSWMDDSHDIYVRDFNGVKSYPKEDIRHYIYSKTLTEDEKRFYE